MVATYCYLKKENDKVWEFHMSNCSYFEISASLQLVPALKLRNEINIGSVY